MSILFSVIILSSLLRIMMIPIDFVFCEGGPPSRYGLKDPFSPGRSGQIRLTNSTQPPPYMLIATNQNGLDIYIVYLYIYICIRTIVFYIILHYIILHYIIYIYVFFYMLYYIYAYFIICYIWRFGVDTNESTVYTLPQLIWHTTPPWHCSTDWHSKWKKSGLTTCSITHHPSTVVSIANWTGPIPPTHLAGLITVLSQEKEWRCGRWRTLVRKGLQCYATCFKSLRPGNGLWTFVVSTVCW